MASADPGPYVAETLRERLLCARWILGAAAGGLAGAMWIGALDFPAAAAIGLTILLAATIPTHRRIAVSGLAPRRGSEPGPVRLGMEERLTALVRALPEAALLLDPRGTVLVANGQVRTIAANVRVGDPVSFAVRVPEVLEAIRAATADGVPRRIDFAERVPLDRWLRADIVPIRAARGRENGVTEAVLVAIVDLTPQRRAEQMRVDFIANASHELRTPLASLSGFIETLQGPARNDANARERFLKIMGEQARRMSRLIDDLLSLSRIELNAHLKPQAEIDLAALIGHVHDTLTPLGHERGVEIVLAGAQEQIIVHGDRDELIRVFENLIENATKYGGSGGRVEVSLTREGEEVVVAVRDFGPGIPPEHVPRLTERFYRVDTAHSREQGGTGLGLAIVKHIVARHRGRLSIKSVPGDGATFSVRLAAEFRPAAKNSAETVS